MNQQNSAPDSRTPPRRWDKPHRSANPDAAKSRLALRLPDILRGLGFGAVAYLFGCAVLPFGAMPFGVAILAAASAYIPYIVAGLVLAALVSPVGLGTGGLIGVYAAVLALRVVMRFLLDPPLLPTEKTCTPQEYLTLLSRRVMALTRHEESTPMPRLLAEHPFLRMLTAAAGGFLAGALRLILRGAHVYDLLGLLLGLALAPLATFLLVPSFGEVGLTLLFSPTPLSDKPAHRPLRGQSLSERDGGAARLLSRFHPLVLLGGLFLPAAVVFSARGLSLDLWGPYLTLSTAPLLSLLFTLGGAARLGIIPGMAVGIACGLAADPLLAPVFILAAGGYALLRPLSHRAGVVGGTLLGGAFLPVVERMSGLLTHLPMLLLAPPLILVLDRLQNSLSTVAPTAEADPGFEAFADAISATLSAESRAGAQRARLKALSEAFASLSQRFYALSGQLRRPRTADLRRACDEAFGKQCTACAHRDACWGSGYDRTVELEAHLASRLRSGKPVAIADLPAELREFCPSLPTILEDINRRLARMTEALLRSERTEGYAADYAALARLLEDALAAEDRERATESLRHNREAADRIYTYLSSLGVTSLGVVVSGEEGRGRRRVLARGVGLDSLSVSPRELRDQIESLCGARLAPPIFEPAEPAATTGTGSTVMTLLSEPALSVRYAGSTAPAGWDRKTPPPPPLTHTTSPGAYAPPDVCGDHIALFSTGDDYFYALISDGMGSGEEASLTSDICAVFLERMLAAGNRVELSLSMLDSYIRAKNVGTGSECSATVDIMELDLMDGHATFAKNGASPTYVVREGTIYRLNSHTLPIGILRDASPELLCFRVHPGDVVVMVSDGITRGREECPWLMDLLSAPLPTDMDVLRRDIIRRALATGSEDDLTAIAIRVEGA